MQRSPAFTCCVSAVASRSQTVASRQSPFAAQRASSIVSLGAQAVARSLARRVATSDSAPASPSGAILSGSGWISAGAQLAPDCLLGSQLGGPASGGAASRAIEPIIETRRAFRPMCQIADRSRQAGAPLQSESGSQRSGPPNDGQSEPNLARSARADSSIKRDRRTTDRRAPPSTVNLRLNSTGHSPAKGCMQRERVQWPTEVSCASGERPLSSARRTRANSGSASGRICELILARLRNL